MLGLWYIIVADEISVRTVFELFLLHLAEGTVERTQAVLFTIGRRQSWVIISCSFGCALFMSLLCAINGVTEEERYKKYRNRVFVCHIQ